jgi:AcrR family transcriptional regulator
MNTTTTRERLVHTSIKLIAEGDGFEMVIVRKQLAAAAAVAPGTVTYHFGTQESLELEKALIEHVRDEVVREAQENAAAYEQLAELAEETTDVALLRSQLRKTLVNDLADYDASDGAPAPLVGRERLYYLMLAMCGLSEPLDYARTLYETADRSQERYSRAYEEWARIACREFIVDSARTQRAVNAYLEGITAHRRFGYAPDADEIVDTVMRIFHSTTTPIGEEPTDVESEVFGRRSSHPAE